MNLLFIVSLLVLALYANLAQCARILGIFVMPSKSHYHLGSGLLKGLAERGHDVTFISPYDEKYQPKNPNGTYRVVSVADVQGFKPQRNLFDMAGINPLFFTVFMNMMGNEISEKVLSHSNIKKLIESDATFDAVIIEQFQNDALKVFAHHYKAPLVLFASFDPNPWANYLVGNPAPPSYIPEIVIDFKQENFIDRLKNSLLTAFSELNRQLYFYPAQNRLMKKYFPDAPDLSGILYNASLVLVNSHVSTNKPAPRVPCMVDIGGYHVKPPKKLPKDLQTFLDNAKEGVVYFSMGSVLKGTDLPEEKRKMFLNAFAKLKQKVLWKWESDDMPDKPSNVYLHKWLPQTDVLGEYSTCTLLQKNVDLACCEIGRVTFTVSAHPNVKLFITHGGLLSTIETVHIGMQILAIPVFGDQRSNAKGAVAGGFGKAVYFEDLSEAALDENIRELLTNPKYMENAKTRSRLMHDRLVHPMDEADYWVRYVIRHKGATHLRVSGLSLPWYQYLSLDVVLVVLLVSLLLIYINFKVAVWICSKLCRSKNTSQKKVKKN